MVDGRCVRPSEEEYAVRSQAVTPGASDLLVVRLQTFGQRIVKHQPQIWLVYAHPERDSGDDETNLVSLKEALILLAQVIVQTGVIWKCLEPQVGELGGE